MQFRRVFNACRIQRLRLWQKQLQEAWSIIKPLITLGTDTDAAVNARFPPSCGWTGLAENRSA
jgi:hypothetical protein